MRGLFHEMAGLSHRQRTAPARSLQLIHLNDWMTAIMNAASFCKTAFVTLCLAGAAFPLLADAQATPRRIAFEQGNDEPYAIVRDGQRTTYVGRHQRDDDEVEALRKHAAGTFIWFRQAGKAYVVRDPATVAQVSAAWARADQLSADMKQYEAPMHEKGAAMKALSQKMVAARADGAATEAVGQQMADLGKSMDALGKQMGALGKQIERESKQADATSRNILREALQNGKAQAVVGAY